jgi:hypothetical protein
MNRLSNTDRTRVIACLVEGNSIRSTVRITGIAKKTVSRLGVELGQACERFANKVFVDLPCKFHFAENFMREKFQSSPLPAKGTIKRIIDQRQARENRFLGIPVLEVLADKYIISRFEGSAGDMTREGLDSETKDFKCKRCGSADVLLEEVLHIPGRRRTYTIGCNKCGEPSKFIKKLTP